MYIGIPTLRSGEDKDTVFKCTQHHKVSELKFILSKMNRIGDITLPDTKIYCKAIVNKNRKVKREPMIKNRRGSSEINTCNLSSNDLFFQKGQKLTMRKGDSLY